MTSAYAALALNADFTPLQTFPLSVWGFERTMRHMLKDNVIGVEFYDAELRSQKMVYRPPSVIALKRYVSPPRQVAFTRMNVFLRDDFRCQYCGEQFSSRDLTFDHVIPRKDGGGTCWENIVSACVPCNSTKGHRRDMNPLRAPFRPVGQKFLKLSRASCSTLQPDWLSHLYWCGALEED